MEIYELYKEISNRNPDVGKSHFEYKDIKGNHNYRYFIPEWLGIPECSNSWVSGRSIRSVLSSIGLDNQLYYDLVILGLSSPDDRPRCQCGSPVKFMSLAEGYREFCSKSCAKRYITEETRKKRGNSLRVTMNNPEVRQRMSDSHKRENLSPETRLRLSESMKGNTNGKGPRSEESILNMVEAQNRPEVAEKKSKSLKDTYSRPDIRDKKSKSQTGLKRKLSTRRKISKARTEYLKAHPESVKPWGYVKFKVGSLYLPRFNKEVRYESSYERDLLSILDSSDEISSVDRSKLHIQYYNDERGKVCNYYPDFIVKLNTGHKLLIEVKPNYRLSNSVVIAKAAAAVEFCKSNDLQYVILTEDDLYDGKTLNYKLDLFSKIRSNQSND